MGSNRSVEPLGYSISAIVATVFAVKAVRYVVHGDTHVSDEFVEKTVTAWNVILTIAIVGVILGMAIVINFEILTNGVPASVEVTFHE